MKLISEKEKCKWYTTDETKIVGEYIKSKGLENYYVSLVEMKEDKRQEYILLKADEEGTTEAVYASSTISEMITHIDLLTSQKI
jgi:hypothetical protein